MRERNRDDRRVPTSLRRGVLVNDASPSAFDPLHRVATMSVAYREAVRASSPDLPDWLVPASVLDASDLALIARALSLSPGETFVDLGCGACGPAISVVERTGTSFIGVDQSAVALRAADELAAGRGLSKRTLLVRADVSATGLPDACADGVMSIDTLMFVDPSSAVAEIARILRMGRSAIVRTVESLVEPFTPTIVQDYRPLFEANGLAVTRHEEVAGYRGRSVAFFRAILERMEAIRAEVGDDAAALIGEAAESIEKATAAPRVRTVYIEAVRQ